MIFLCFGTFTCDNLTLCYKVMTMIDDDLFVDPGSHASQHQYQAEPFSACNCSTWEICNMGNTQHGKYAIWELFNCLIWEICNMGKMQCGKYAIWEKCNIGTMKYGGNAMWEIYNMGKMQYGKMQYGNYEIWGKCNMEYAQGKFNTGSPTMSLFWALGSLGPRPNALFV